MASSLAVKICHNFLQCGICLESFQNPRALPCLHSFCEECLERWYKTNKKKNPSVLICPNCAHSAEIPSEGIKGFPAHFLVNSLKETVNMEKAIKDYSDKLCTKCNTVEKKAKVYCKDCKHFLCGSCLDIHNTWDIYMKHHDLVKVEDLTSGKVTLSDLDQQDQNCAEHDGEQKRFYCETCDKPVCRDCIVLKQCCRDHDTIPIKQASDKHVSCLKKYVQTCREKKEECQDAFERTKLIKNDLSKAVTNAKDALAIKKAAFHQEIDDIFSAHENDINDLHKQRKAKLTEDTDNLKTLINQIDSTLELGVNLTESGSPYDIVSNYRSVLSRIQKVTDIEVNKVDETLADIPTPIVECVLGKQWEQTGKFKVECGYDYPAVAGIAANSDGNIAVCQSYSDNVIVYSRSGEVKHTFPITGGLGGLYDVAITPSNTYVIPKNNKCCQLYNSQFKLISEFQTCNANNQPSVAVSVTVDKDGCIILGMKDNVISIHNTDGSVQSRFAIPYKPKSVAVTSKQEIIVVTNTNIIQLLDYSGKSILTFDPPEVNTWEPCNVCCSKRDEVFVVNDGDPHGIYKYTAGGVYMGCITTQIDDPEGIALSHDDKELFVTDIYWDADNDFTYEYEEVKTFQRP